MRRHLGWYHNTEGTGCKTQPSWLGVHNSTIWSTETVHLRGDSQAGYCVGSSRHRGSCSRSSLTLGNYKFAHRANTHRPESAIDCVRKKTNDLSAMTKKNNTVHTVFTCPDIYIPLHLNIIKVDLVSFISSLLCVKCRASLLFGEIAISWRWSFC